MPRLKKTWRERLSEDKDLPRVVEITDKMSRRWGTGTCVIPAPREVDEIMAMVPAGRLITVNQIRAVLAGRHGTTIGCPITTGIFMGIAAKAAEEAAAEGVADITPYWRTLKEGGKLNPKFPGGVAAQAALLQTEGHEIVAGRSKDSARVKEYEKALVEV